VDACFKRLSTAQSSRHQRALFLELLDGLRGVPMSEKGKLPRASKQRAIAEKERKAQQMKYAEERRKSPDLGGVADMFA
jgi:exportin-5